MLKRVGDKPTICTFLEYCVKDQFCGHIRLFGRILCKNLDIISFSSVFTSLAY